MDIRDLNVALNEAELAGIRVEVEAARAIGRAACSDTLQGALEKDGLVAADWAVAE